MIIRTLETTVHGRYLFQDRGAERLLIGSRRRDAAGPAGGDAGAPCRCSGLLAVAVSAAAQALQRSSPFPFRRACRTVLVISSAGRHTPSESQG